MLRRKSELDNKLQRQKNPSPLNIRKYFTNSNSSLFRKNFSSKCTKREWQYWWIPPCLDQLHFQKIFKKLKTYSGTSRTALSQAWCCPLPKRALILTTLSVSDFSAHIYVETRLVRIRFHNSNLADLS